MKKADIKVGFRCNNLCRFCVQGGKRASVGDRARPLLMEILEEARRDCCDVVFTGGEPTIKKEIITLVKHAKKLDFHTIQIQSNGRMFRYERFCDEIISAGANEFSPALHGHLPRLHDFLTRSKGSFEETLLGIQNLKKRGMRVITNTVITKPNYRHLPQIARLLCSLNVDQYQFAFVHVLGRANKNYAAIVPRKSLVEPYVKKGLDVGIQKGLNVMTEAIPFCFMSGYEEHISEKIIPETKIFDAGSVVDDFTASRQKEGKIKGLRCQKCRYVQSCEGPWREYPQIFGWEEFKPVL